MSGSMDQRLIAWARAVKRRTRNPGPVLWLFTDSSRGANPLRAAARLPKGLCGVVYRHDTAPDRAALGRALARICRARDLELAVAGDIRLAHALAAGLHLRAGRFSGPQAANLRRRRPLTSSAHNIQDIRRARAAGATAIFLSPAFPPASHPGAPALGPARWSAMARGKSLLALGGITGHTARALPRHCRGAGAIGALGG
jgi:thiamine-phosphate pyrophosphorylase